jgi:hypothetical protein
MRKIKQAFYKDKKMELFIDEERLNRFRYTKTGVFVRAKFPDGHFDSVDIFWLTKESLAAWLGSRGGNNPWAEQLVYILLEHE